MDANEGWTDKEEAIRKINWLASQSWNTWSSLCPRNLAPVDSADFDGNLLLASDPYAV